jgi:hypothetical protein
MPITQHGKLSFAKTTPQFVGRPIEDFKEGNADLYQRMLVNQQTIGQMEEIAQSINVKAEDKIHKDDAIQSLQDDLSDIVENDAYAYAGNHIYKAAKRFKNNQELRYSIKDKAQIDAWTKKAKEDGVDENTINAFYMDLRRRAKTIEIDEDGTVKNMTYLPPIVKTPDFKKQLEEAMKFAKSQKRVFITGRNGKPVQYDYVDNKWLRAGTTTYSDDAKIQAGLLQNIMNNPENQPYFKQLNYLYDSSLKATDENGKYITDEKGNAVYKNMDYTKEVAKALGINKTDVINKALDYNNSLPEHLRVVLPSKNDSQGWDEHFEEIYRKSRTTDNLLKLVDSYVNLNHHVQEDFKLYTDYFRLELLKHKNKLAQQKAEKELENKLNYVKGEVGTIGNPNIPKNIGDFYVKSATVNTQYNEALGLFRRALKTNPKFKGENAENVTPIMDENNGVHFNELDGVGNYKIQSKNIDFSKSYEIDGESYTLSPVITPEQYKNLPVSLKSLYDVDVSLNIRNKMIEATRMKTNYDRAKEKFDNYIDTNKDAIDIHKFKRNLLSSIPNGKDLRILNEKLKPLNMKISVNRGSWHGDTYGLFKDGKYITSNRDISLENLRTLEAVLQENGIKNKYNTHYNEKANEFFEDAQDAYNSTIPIYSVDNKTDNKRIADHVKTWVVTENRLVDATLEPISSNENGFTLGKYGKDTKTATTAQIQSAIMDKLNGVKHSATNKEYTTDDRMFITKTQYGKYYAVFKNLPVTIGEDETYVSHNPIFVEIDAEMATVVESQMRNDIITETVDTALNDAEGLFNDVDQSMQLVLPQGTYNIEYKEIAPKQFQYHVTGDNYFKRFSDVANMKANFYLELEQYIINLQNTSN